MWDTIVYSDVTLFDLFMVIVIIIVGVFIAKIVSVSLRRSLSDDLEANQLQILLKVVFYTIVIFTLIIVIPMLGVDWKGMLVAGGIAGLVIAFASQSIISNLIAGIFLFADRPIKIGDLVNINGQEGFVEDIKLLSTRIRGYNGYLYRIPNEKAFNNVITNYSSQPVRRFEYEIGIRYSDDADKAVEIINNLVEEHVYVLKNPAHQAFVDSLGDNAVIIIVRLWAPVPVWYDVKMEFLWKIKAVLQENGIEIPFPQRTIWYGNKPKV